MINRALQDIVISSLKNHPVVGMLGSRQVGKTTLAKTIKDVARPDAVYLDLELPSDINKLQDAELYLRQFESKLVIIDEIQRMPSLFALIRALVDRNRIGGRFLILGSASPDLIRHSSESLAGRIIYHELAPLRLSETGAGGFQNLLLRGGYPESFLAENDDESFVWRESYIKTYLEMDIPQLDIRIPSVQLRRFWTMLAHCHGQLWNASKIAGSLGVSAPTVRRYLDILEETFIVRQLQPYHSNTKKRMIKAPKVYIRDSGLNHALLRIRTFDDLLGHPSIGASWEGFVIEQIASLLPQNSELYFYRTNAGAEIDLLYLDQKNQIVPVEIKYSLSPSVSRGFWNAYEDLSCRRGYVVYPGQEMFPLGKNVSALPLEMLAQVMGVTS
ncbi:MAG: ATP-binding protein [Proteobacteria bacterium]|nr:ATP-binding protein [Pseudomonadota bacterium]MBU2260695.1 ATP-binding protein [Pseudomonadota bacterium]